jgi:uncharacterized protein YwbE
VTEAFDLDYKRTTYGSSDGDKRALRVDVAALANTAGGVIVIGVAEDTQARAAAAPGVLLSDGEIGRMRQIVAPGVSPMPVFDILSIPDETDPALGFYVIAVPRSPSAPHAVLVGDSLRYPKRNGATTRYPSEPELATAYRDRTAGGARQKSRIAEIETEAIDRLTLNGPWLVLSVLRGHFKSTAGGVRHRRTARRHEVQGTGWCVAIELDPLTGEILRDEHCDSVATGPPYRFHRGQEGIRCGTAANRPRKG